jgi:hypothetical protein
METVASVQAWAAALTVSDWLAIGSIVIAAASFLISQAAVRRQEQLQIEALRTARDSDLIAWADLAIDAIADVQRHCRDVKNALLIGPDAARNQSELRTRLSALLDRGRLFFPNQPPGEDEDSPVGETAYVGEAQPAIDALHQVFRLITDFGRFEMTPADAVKAVVAHRRRFVSEVFISIDPRRRDATLRRWGARSA